MSLRFTPLLGPTAGALALAAIWAWKLLHHLVNDKWWQPRLEELQQIVVSVNQASTSATQTHRPQRSNSVILTINLGHISLIRKLDLHIQRSTEPLHQSTMKGCSNYTATPQLNQNSPGTKPEHCMNYLGGWIMTDPRNAMTFIDGATAFKNAMDLTEEHSSTWVWEDEVM